MDIKKFQMVTRTELQRDSGEVFDNLLRGRAALIEKHSKPQAVLLEIFRKKSLDPFALRML